MATNPKIGDPASATSRLPIRLHHSAYVCANQERTRHFYEDVLGFPLLAAWVEEADLPDFPGGKRSFSHTFFGIADGGALAFFNFPDPEVADFYKAKQQSMFVHIALAVDEDAYQELKKRLIDSEAFAMEYEHGYCKSVYGHDPDGLLIEFTVDPPDVDKINDYQRKTAHETLRRWAQGDRTLNNDIRPHH
jgi:glyoxylase I family protein